MPCMPTGRSSSMQYWDASLAFDDRLREAASRGGFLVGP